MGCCKRLVVMAAALGACAAHALGQASLANAQVAEVARRGEDVGGGARRVLGGHAYFPSQLVRDPFTSTYVDSRTGGGLAEGQGPIFNAMGEAVGVRDYTLAAAAEAIEFQLGVLPWLAFRLNATGSIYTGTSAASVLAIGAATTYEATAGATAGWNLSEGIRLGALLDVVYNRRYSFDVLTGVGLSISSRELQEDEFLSESKGPQLAPGLSGAFTLHPSLGLVTNVSYRHDTESGELVATGADVVTASAGADLDFGELFGFPLGVMVAYRLTEPIGDGDRAQALDSGVFYSGKQELDLGLQLGLRRFPSRADSSFDAAIGILTMRYYWQ